MNISETLEKISIIVSVPVPVLLIIPLIIAMIFHAVRVIGYKKQPDDLYNNKANREYLNKKNNFAAVLSAIFIIVSAYISYSAFYGEPIKQKTIEDFGLRR